MTGSPSAQQPHRFAHRTVDFSSTVLVMAIINRTPDSFYDAGRNFAFSSAMEASRRALADGADWLDIGGVPFAPGEELPWEEEANRIVPVIAALRRESSCIISADTFHPEVAKAALEAGADVINDTTGLYYPELAEVIAAADAHLVLTHSLATPRTHYPRPHYDDIVAEISNFFRERLARAQQAGIPAEKIILDPGPDLNKNTLHTLELVRRFHEFSALGYPLLAATSNKDFLGETLGLPKRERLIPSIATAVMCLQAGARILRVHEVKETVQAARMFSAVQGWWTPTDLRHNMGEKNIPASQSL